MKLKDFYYADKHRAGTLMAIPLPSGEDSGEWLQVMGPDCDEAIQAGRAYTAAYRAAQAELEPLLDKCKEREDYTEYNERHSNAVEDLNRQLAGELIVGWSFDDPFSKQGAIELLAQYRGLADLVAKHYTKSREVLAGK